MRFYQDVVAKCYEVKECVWNHQIFYFMFEESQETVIFGFVEKKTGNKEENRNMKSPNIIS